MDLDNAATLRRIDEATLRRGTNQTPYVQGGSLGSMGKQEPRGLVATLQSLDPWAKAALLWSVAQLVVLLIAEGLVMKAHFAEYSDLLQINATNPTDLMVQGSSSSVLPNAQALSIYEGLLIAAEVFQTYLAFDAIMTSSKIQLLASVAFNLACFGYSIAQYIQAANLISISNVGDVNYANFLVRGFTIHRSGPYEIAVSVLSAIFLFGWAAFSYKLYNLFGWSVFKELGADVEVRKRLTVYHIYMMLLKIDVFFFISFAIQYVLLAFPDDGSGQPSLAKVVTAVFCPIGVIVLLLIAYYAVTRESNVLMTLLLIGLSGGIGYLVDRVIDIWTVSDVTRYKSCKMSLTLFTTLTILVSLATFGVAVLNFLNFGKGLMTALNNKKTATIDRSLELNYIANGSRRSGSYGTPNPSTHYKAGTDHSYTPH
ncbi:hypothetical protein BC830DRAFT_1170627 [Chytriomyces sp. MP71]|nr:hypothetical protein BC830DRAFT_1170627 [Chytriomyces sp. MP71]